MKEFECTKCHGKDVNKCSCYRDDHRCNGTREIDVCSCNGDESKCDFYPEKRIKNAEYEIFKKEKLTELCEQLENERNCARNSLAETRAKLEKAEKYRAAFEDMDKLLKIIKKLPADDFFQLYRGMESMVDRSKYSYTTISNSGMTSISGR